MSDPSVQRELYSSPSEIRPASTPRSAKHAAVVIGGAADVPRALEHPGLTAPHLSVVGVVVVEDDDTLLGQHAEALHALIETHRAGVVMVAGPIGRALMRAVSDIAQVQGCRLLSVMPAEVVAGHEPVVLWEGDAPLVQLAAHRGTARPMALKRAVDIAVSATALVALAPILGLTALAIRLNSRGPALFRHRRVGAGGREFDCLKFRSMRQDAETILAADPSLRALYRANGYKLPEHLDHRVTAVGRWLRRSSIDELPQLVNVLRGEMSLVGPRPVVRDELEHYRGSERLFLSMRPGMTGAWAVSGRHHVGYPARAELELGYVRRWSLRADLRILLGTLRAVLAA